MKEEETKIKYEEVRKQLKFSLNAKCWDGRWYKRAFTDDGRVLRKYDK